MYAAAVCNLSWSQEVGLMNLPAVDDGNTTEKKSGFRAHFFDMGALVQKGESRDDR